MATRQQRISKDVESSEEQSLEPAVRVGDEFVQNKRMVLPQNQSLPINDFIKVGKAVQGFSQSLGTMMDALEPSKEEEQEEALNKASELLRSYDEHKDWSKSYGEVEALRGTYSDYQYRLINERMGSRLANDFIAKQGEEYDSLVNPDNTLGRSDSRAQLEEQLRNASSDWLQQGVADGGWLEDDNFQRTYYESVSEWSSGFTKKVSQEHKKNTVEREQQELVVSATNDIHSFFTDLDGVDETQFGTLKTQLDEIVGKFVVDWGGSKGDIPDGKISEMTHNIIAKASDTMKDNKNADDLRELKAFVEATLTNHEAVENGDAKEFKVNIRGLNKEMAMALVRTVGQDLKDAEEVEATQDSQDNEKVLRALKTQSLGILANDELMKQFKGTADKTEQKKILSTYLGTVVNEDGSPMFEKMDSVYMQQQLDIIHQDFKSTLQNQESTDNQGSNLRLVEAKAHLTSILGGFEVPDKWEDMTDAQKLDILDGDTPFTDYERRTMASLLNQDRNSRAVVRSHLGYNQNNPIGLLSGNALVEHEAIRSEIKRATDPLNGDGTGVIPVDLLERQQLLQDRINNITLPHIQALMALDPSSEGYLEEVKRRKQEIRASINDLYTADTKVDEGDEEPLSMVTPTGNASTQTPFRADPNQLARLSSEGNKLDDQVAVSGLTSDGAEKLSEDLVLISSNTSSKAKTEAGVRAREQLSNVENNLLNTTSGWENDLRNGTNPIIYVNRDWWGTSVDVEMQSFRASSFPNLDRPDSQGGNEIFDMSDGDYYYIATPQEGAKYANFVMFNETTFSGWFSDDHQTSEEITAEAHTRMKEVFILQGPQTLRKVMALDGQFRLNNDDINSLIVPFNDSDMVQLFAPRVSGLTTERLTDAEWIAFTKNMEENNDAWKNSSLGQYHTRYRLYGGTMSALEYVQAEYFAHKNFGMIADPQQQQN